MTCQVVISDYVAERRMIFVLEDDDFSECDARQGDSDELLHLFCNHPFFAGCKCWRDLTLEHYHALIINILKISARHSDHDVTDKSHATIRRLTFFLCALVARLESASDSRIDLLRVARIAAEDVTYDYSARLDIKITRPQRTLRIVIDNEN
jgi:hypothetical protein